MITYALFIDNVFHSLYADNEEANLVCNSFLTDNKVVIWLTENQVIRFGKIVEFPSCHCSYAKAH